MQRRFNGEIWCLLAQVTSGCSAIGESCLRSVQKGKAGFSPGRDLLALTFCFDPI